jgi:FlaA1/EpsC-like NDP-sugar epimerase
MGQGGEIFILDMGRPVKIVDLARDLITLSGLRPDEDIKIEFSGVRPGEKLFEELSTSAEHADKTKHPKIFIGRIATRAWEDISADIERMVGIADSATADELRTALMRIVPEYAPPATVPTTVPVPATATNTSPANTVSRSTRNSSSNEVVPELPAVN